MTDTPEFPPAFASADSFSLDGQRRTIRGISSRLWLTVVATVFLAVAPLWPTEFGDDHHGEHHDIEIAALAAAALFLVAFVIELVLLRTRPERAWYDGRAVAESVKTLTWRYAVGGQPYPIERPDSADAFAHDIDTLGTDIESLQLAVTDGGRPTAWMKGMRARPLDERRDTYLRERVRDQEEWYARKASHNQRRATAWSFILLTAEALGVALALLKGLSIISIDLASVAAAVIASGAAWLAVKQHESIATAYALASSELVSVHVRLLGVEEEEAWAEEVAGAEEAISREHTMWRASRSKPEPPRTLPGSPVV